MQEHANPMQSLTKSLNFDIAPVLRGHFMERCDSDLYCRNENLVLYDTQEHTGNTGMDQLLGALGPELEAHEAEEGSDSDDDAVSGTDQGAVPTPIF